METTCPTCGGAIDAVHLLKVPVFRCRKCNRIKAGINGEWHDIKDRRWTDVFFGDVTKCECGQPAIIFKSQPGGMMLALCRKCNRKKPAGKLAEGGKLVDQAEHDRRQAADIARKIG